MIAWISYKISPNIFITICHCSAVIVRHVLIIDALTRANPFSIEMRGDEIEESTKRNFLRFDLVRYRYGFGIIQLDALMRKDGF